MGQNNWLFRGEKKNYERRQIELHRQAEMRAGRALRRNLVQTRLKDRARDTTIETDLPDPLLPPQSAGRRV